MVLATDGEHFIDVNDSETNEDEFHRQFISELKKKELIERLKQDNNN